MKLLEPDIMDVYPNILSNWYNKSWGSQVHVILLFLKSKKLLRK